MRVDAVELVRLRIPLVVPFRTSFGTQDARDVLLVRVCTPEADGWGECVAMEAPLYSAEYTQAAHRVMVEHLLPRLFAVADLRPARVAEIFAPVHKRPLRPVWLSSERRHVSDVPPVMSPAEAAMLNGSPRPAPQDEAAAAGEPNVPGWTPGAWQPEPPSAGDPHA